MTNNEKLQIVWEIFNDIDEFMADLSYNDKDTPCPEWVLKLYEKKRQEGLFCDRYGHYVVNDHCGLPEHRFCAFCEKMMPHESLSWARAESKETSL